MPQNVDGDDVFVAAGEVVEPPAGCCRCLIMLRAIFTILIAAFSLAWFIAGV